MSRSLLLVALLCASVVVAVPLQKLPEAKAFRDYMTKFGKVYDTTEEFQLRFENYKASATRIAKENASSKGAVYALNKFSDMSPQEFQTKVLMTPRNASTAQPDPSMVLQPKDGIVAPSSLDWRDKNAVTAVKNQEQCGSCWAFSVAENVESMWLLSGKGSVNSLNLAPQQIVDCDKTDAGCNGGDPPTAYAYLISAGGLEDESKYPYTGRDGTCKFSAGSVDAKISSWKYATSGYSETTLQNNLVSWGPLSICLDATHWQDYSSGVMSWSECAWVNLLDHCVQLVGYNSQGSSPYWIVRNSWGTDWGIDGYIWLEMWKDTCGLAHEATTAVV